MESHESCAKFIDRILPEAFTKLLKSNATQRWQGEIQEGIYDMIELFIDMLLARLEHKESNIPVGLLDILAMAFDVANDYHEKNADRAPRGRWEGGGRAVQEEFAKPMSGNR